MTVTDPAQLARLDDGELWELMRHDLHGAQAELWQALTTPEMVGRVRAILAGRDTDLQAQLIQRQAALEAFREECYQRGPDGKADWFAAKADYNRWRRRAVGMRRALQDRLTVLRVARQGGHQLRMEAERSHYRRLVRTLAVAIAAHRQASAAAGIDPEPHDRTLWAALDRQLEDGQHNDDPQTLAELVASGVWH
jgi:hypothetical protein